jgi:hypothetical protein
MTLTGPLPQQQQQQQVGRRRLAALRCGSGGSCGGSGTSSSRGVTGGGTMTRSGKEAQKAGMPGRVGRVQSCRHSRGAASLCGPLLESQATGGWLVGETGHE